MKYFSEQRFVNPFNQDIEIQCEPTRNGFLKELYKHGLVEATEFSAHCSDKLCFAKMIEFLLPENTFHPKSRGIRELLPNVKEQISKEFLNPLVKPVASMGSNGEGIYFDINSFYLDFSKDSEKFLIQEPSPLSGIFSSGERFMVQEKVGHKEYEYRLHSLEGRVVSGATFTRWDQDWVLEKFLRAEKSLQEFLDLLPAWFTARQAWSFDLIEGSEKFYLVEVNTNRGRQKHWSGDLVNPDTLQAYAIHLEKFYGARFVSEGAKKIYAGEASSEMYLEKFGEEAVRRHSELRKQLK
jgi:hypothetical protein